MRIAVKRVYEKAAKSDGTRVLVDRLWPRGLSKARARVDVWAKNVAPSDKLRKWFHADPEKRYKTFAAKYRKELAGNSMFPTLRAHKKITLLTAVKDVDHSHVRVLVETLRR